MKQNLTYVVSIVAIIIFGFACSAYSRTPEKQLVGKWTEVNGADQIEFKNDGSFLGRMAHGMESTQINITGTYFVENDLISIKLNKDYPMTWKFKFSAGKLVITYQQGGQVKINGSMAKFKRGD